MISLTSTIAQFIERLGLIAPNYVIIVAVSGGLDSRVLLEVLRDLQQSWRLTLVIAHLNHRLRGAESDRDEDFVRYLADRLMMPLEIERAEGLKSQAHGGRSIQVIARAWRYKMLEAIRLRHVAQRVALGHTKTDQAETVLMRLIRGTGLAGLSGIPAAREGGIIRPLLETRREELLSFARERQLDWVEDSTNATSVYIRNQVRHELLPVLYRLNPQVETALAQVAETSRRENSFLERETQKLRGASWICAEEQTVRIRRNSFVALDPALQQRLLRMLALEYADTANEQALPGPVHLSAGLDLIMEGKGTRRVSWPGGLLLTVSSTRIWLGRKGPGEGDWSLLEVQIDQPGLVELPSGESVRISRVGREQYLASPPDRKMCWLDERVLSWPLLVRYPRVGDRFHPLGAPSSTRLSEFFIRQKVPKHERIRTPLVLNGTEIIWVAGLRSGEPGKLSLDSDKVVCLELTRSGLT